MITIEAVLDRFASARILVIGDVMLDRFVYGEVSRVSPEAPSLVIAVGPQAEMLGGAGNVAVNVAALGGRCVLVGLVGNDDAGAAIRRLLAGEPRLQDATVQDAGRPSTLKVRFVSRHHNTHLLRADWESAEPLCGETAAAVVDKAVTLVGECDAVILSDYGKGVLTDAVIRPVIHRAREQGVPVIVDPKGRDYARYAGATAVTPNLLELSQAVDHAVPQADGPIEDSARGLLARTGINALVVKRSEYGAQVVRPEEASLAIPPAARRVVDVSGAGDTFVAALTLATAAGAPIGEASRIANAAGGLAVEKSGTACVSADELRAFMIPRPAMQAGRKIVTDWETLKAIRAQWREDGLVVGFTNGCFDLLHPGHVYLLAEARSRVDRLVVALNSDSSVRRLKGASRPIQVEDARLAVMGALDAASAVTLFADDTPLALIRHLVPDVLFKGADYALNEIVGRDVVEAAGGRVELIDLVPDSSTTGIVQKMAVTG